MKRTFKGTPGFVKDSGFAVKLELRDNGKGTWLCVYDERGRFAGTIEGHTLRRLAESILEALPPKRGQS